MKYTKAQLVALNTFLNDWPEGMAFNDVLACLRQDDMYGIYANQDYENLWANHLAQLIADLHDYCVSVYGK